MVEAEAGGLLAAPEALEVETRDGRDHVASHDSRPELRGHRAQETRDLGDEAAGFDFDPRSRRMLSHRQRASVALAGRAEVLGKLRKSLLGVATGFDIEGRVATHEFT